MTRRLAQQERIARRLAEAEAEVARLRERITEMERAPTLREAAMAQRAVIARAIGERLGRSTDAYVLALTTPLVTEVETHE